MPPRQRQQRPQGDGGNRNQNRNRRKKQNDKPTEKELRNLAADYGWAYSVLEEFPQLFKVFNEAVEQSWSPQRFIAEIQDTPWFRRHSDVWRQTTYLQLTDPTTFQKRVNEVARQIQDAAGSLGIEPGNKQITEWAEQALKFGWDQAKINNLLAKSVKITGKHTVGGSLAQTQDRLESFAFANGVQINKPTTQKWLQQIVRGNSTVEEYEQYITKMAVAKFPNWHKELKAGMTIAEIAEPYRQTMAQMLELNPATVNLNNRMLRSALSHKNENGEWAEASISDFEDMLRQDPRWQYTDNARETVAGITASLLQTFGEVS